MPSDTFRHDDIIYKYDVITASLAFRPPAEAGA